jgi:hypothetical protein
MTPHERTLVRLPHPHAAQRAILQHPARFKVVACGRRFGKTELGKIALMEQVSHAKTVWWLAPTYQVAGQVWRDVRALLRPYTVEVNNSEHRIELFNGGHVEVRSTHSADYLRGAGLDYAILDEAAFMGRTVWSEVVRPMLLDRAGGALFLSTPYGRNWFWDAYQRGTSPRYPEWASFHYPSSANPRLPASELDAIRAETPARVFATEYEAQFSDDAGAVFRGVREVATAPPHAQPVAGHRYVMGVDWGRDHDATALAVFDATANPPQMVALERFTRIGYTVQRERLRTVARRWNVEVIWAEANSIGAVNIEELQREGLPVRPFMTTTRSKTPLIDGLAVAIERGDLRILADETLLHELLAYTLERLPGGGVRYSAPSGDHDDTVIATALAWYGVAHGGVRVAFV